MKEGREREREKIKQNDDAYISNLLPLDPRLFFHDLFPAVCLHVRQTGRFVWLKVVIVSDSPRRKDFARKKYSITIFALLGKADAWRGLLKLFEVWLVLERLPRTCVRFAAPSSLIVETIRRFGNHFGMEIEVFLLRYFSLCSTWILYIE